jgi:hypothetical protein
MVGGPLDSIGHMVGFFMAHKRREVGCAPDLGRRGWWHWIMTDGRRGRVGTKMRRQCVGEQRRHSRLDDLGEQGASVIQMWAPAEELTVRKEQVDLEPVSTNPLVTMAQVDPVGSSMNAWIHRRGSGVARAKGMSRTAHV